MQTREDNRLLVWSTRLIVAVMGLLAIGGWYCEMMAQAIIFGFITAIGLPIVIFHPSVSSVLKDVTIRWPPWRPPK
ncbi:MAG: hypothetical protein AAB408_01305 [Patescibacteria group bacterium]